MDDISDLRFEDLQTVCVGMAGTLTHLSLARCQIDYIPDDSGMLFLLLIDLRTLRCLYIESTNIAACVVDTLRTCMPDCRIVF